MEKVPKVKTAKEEGAFWETHSPLEFPDEFEEVKEPIVDRRGRKKGIYIRIDPEAIELARNIGADLGLGYQTLFRMWIMEGLGRYLTRASWGSTAATVEPELGTMLAELPPDFLPWLLLGHGRESAVAEQLRRLLLRHARECEIQHGMRPLEAKHGRRSPKPL